MLITLLSLAHGTTLTAATTGGKLELSVELEEGWKLNEEMGSIHFVDLEPGGETIVFGGGGRIWTGDATPESLRVESLLQVCRETLCKPLALDTTLEVDGPAVEGSPHADPDGLVERQIAVEERTKAAKERMQASVAAGEKDPRYTEAYRQDAAKVLDKTLKKAKKKGRPVLVVLGGKGCAPCAALAHDVLFAEEDPARLQGRVDWTLLQWFDKGLDTRKEQWNLEIALPTILLVDAETETVIAKGRGYGNPETFTSWLDASLQGTASSDQE